MNISVSNFVKREYSWTNNDNKHSNLYNTSMNKFQEVDSVSFKSLPTKILHRTSNQSIPLINQLGFMFAGLLGIRYLCKNAESSAKANLGINIQEDLTATDLSQKIYIAQQKRTCKPDKLNEAYKTLLLLNPKIAKECKKMEITVADFLARKDTLTSDLQEFIKKSDFPVDVNNDLVKNYSKRESLLLSEMSVYDTVKDYLNSKSIEIERKQIKTIDSPASKKKNKKINIYEYMVFDKESQLARVYIPNSMDSYYYYSQNAEYDLLSQLIRECSGLPNLNAIKPVYLLDPEALKHRLAKKVL